MQIDFHHGATYIIARIAGLDTAQASTVAYAAQYVDDATNAGTIQFSDGSAYHRISSAHRMLDYRNFQALAASRVWLPFHFLPGNLGQPAGQSDADRVSRLICLPDSPPARDMVRLCIQAAERPWGLHRLGVTMHVFADTWAHQGFVGVNHAINAASDIRLANGELATNLMDRLAGYFVGSALPLGHGTVLSFPDRPWLKWSYVNGLGQRVVRDNPADFLQAAHRMCQVMRQFVARDPGAVVPGLPAEDRRVFRELLAIEDDNPEARHERWLQAARDGAFSVGADDVHYVDKGRGSWKYRALRTLAAVDSGEEVFERQPGFVASDWKLFHDALQEHRFDIIHRVLPQYDIVTA